MYTFHSGSDGKFCFLTLLFNHKVQCVELHMNSATKKYFFLVQSFHPDLERSLSTISVEGKQTEMNFKQRKNPQEVILIIIMAWMKSNI